MKAYTIDNNGYLTGEIELQPSPLEPGVYFEKPGTVKDTPLPEKEGNAIKWNGESWEYVIDNRGDVYYDTATKEKKIITEIGQEPDATWTKLVPGLFDEWDGKKWVEDIQLYNDSIRQQRSSRYKAESDPLKIEAEYDAQIIGGAPDYSLWLEQVAQIKAALPYK